MPDSTTVHIINHTHWDREWFLTSVYTSRWIPQLIDNLAQRVAGNPDYRFLLDGQTLVIEDLLAVAPEYAAQVDALIANGRLLIGPYYCQPDWQLTGGELLIRNLMLGRQDMEQHGGAMEAGWLVDTFGHIGQSPQIHRLLNITSVYVWRGVPALEPYFHWEGADGSRLLTINLFGGYRNLYGVTHAPEVAVRRLYAEVDKLRPFYPTPDIPLFDGYDLEDNPEDPIAFYHGVDGLVGPGLVLKEATPATFAQEIAGKQLSLPAIADELNSGKYGATFPGTLSARTYLKLLAHDCRQLLLQLCEPLATLAALKGRAYGNARYETWTRILLQNGVHDCICGVSIDQVHEKMEYSYRLAFDEMLADVQESLSAILRDFAAGDYAVSTNPFVTESEQVVDGQLLRARTEGVGVWPVTERIAIEMVDEPVASFTWRNDHYVATIGADGVVGIGEKILGTFMISAEEGDTYSVESGARLGVLRPSSPPAIVEKSARHCVVALSGEWRNEAARITVAVRLHFDQSPLLRWQIDLDSRGTNLRLDMVFETAQPGQLFAGMPFDVVARPAADSDLLPRQLPPELESVLLGQRELGTVSTFPFHDFIALSDGKRTVAILAKGLHAYAADANGTITLTLRRSVEWLTRANLPNRTGDAGPFFYVPDARCERQVRHEVAVAVGSFTAESMTLQALNAGFQNPPLIVRSGEGDQLDGGAETSWQLLQENVPLSSLHVRDGRLLARFYNPTSQTHYLSQSCRQTDVWGQPLGTVDSVPPKKILTVRVAEADPGGDEAANAVRLLTPPPWRVGRNAGAPDPVILNRLKEKIAALEAQLSEIQKQLSLSQGAERLRRQHRYYVLDRERLEFELSHLLNRRKLAQKDALDHDYLYEPDDEIAAVGLKLNHLRIKRRIFDYVVQVL